MGALVPATLAALAAGSLLAAGCQSTQATSAEREAAGQKLVGSEKGVKVTETNPDIKVVDTTLLTDANGSAIVVELKNTSDQGYANVPISVDVKDDKGKSVFKNNLPGLEPALTSMPQIEGNTTAYWVNDQVLATGEPDSAKVKVGISDEPLPSTYPEIKVSEPKLSKEQYSGIEASGEAENLSSIDQEDVRMFAVATEGGKVVAAGRGGIKRLLAGADHPAHYHTFFIGNPEGADDISVVAFPTTLR